LEAYFFSGYQLTMEETLRQNDNIQTVNHQQNFGGNLTPATVRRILINLRMAPGCGETHQENSVANKIHDLNFIAFIDY